MFSNRSENSSLPDHYRADNSGIAKGRDAESKACGSWRIFPPGTLEKLFGWCSVLSAVGS